MFYIKKINESGYIGYNLFNAAIFILDSIQGKIHIIEYSTEPVPIKIRFYSY